MPKRNKGDQANTTIKGYVRRYVEEIDICFCYLNLEFHDPYSGRYHIIQKFSDQLSFFGSIHDLIDSLPQECAALKNLTYESQDTQRACSGAKHFRHLRQLIVGPVVKL